MQDSFVGDIGDYGKYGLLREVCETGLSLSVNWYRTTRRETQKQDDGKFIGYLLPPQIYRRFDPAAFDELHKIVCEENDRRLERIEEAQLFPAVFYSKAVGGKRERTQWHRDALAQTKDTDVVFLDPDNGLETENMYHAGTATEKHVKWTEIRDYYTRGQNVILYQHRPQMTKKEQCVKAVLSFQEEYLLADHVKLLEFPKRTNRFYFMFVHDSCRFAFDSICRVMDSKWSRDGFCREITLN